MLFKYIYTLPNSTTADSLLTDTISAVPIFTPLVLLFVFMIVFLGGITRQKARTGDADYPMWSVVASIATLLVSLIMSVTSGVIQLDWLVVVVVITIFSGAWLFLDKKDGGV